MSDEKYDPRAPLTHKPSMSQMDEGEVGPLFEDEDENEVDLVSTLLGECVSSFLIIFLALGAVYSSAVVTFDVVTIDRLLYISLGYGMVYAATIYAFSYPAADSLHVPNIRHINPAITAVLALTGRFPLGKTILYWLSQFTGGCVAVLFIYWLTPLQKKDITTAYPLLDQVKTYNEWVTEYIFSTFSIFALLMTNFSSVAWKKQPSILAKLSEQTPFTNHELNSVTSGAIIFVCSIAAATVSGGYMNPLFAIGIGILSGNYSAPALVCPFLGAVTALFFGVIFGFEVSWGFRNPFAKTEENKK